MKQRYIRILVYEGEAEWVQECKAKRAVKGSYVLPVGSIREAEVGDFLETLIPLEKENEQTK